MVLGQPFVVADGARQRVSQARVRSTTQRRGRTWKVSMSPGRLTIWTVSLGLSLVLAQPTSLPA